MDGHLNRLAELRCRAVSFLSAPMQSDQAGTRRRAGESVDLRECRQGAGGVRPRAEGRDSLPEAHSGLHDDGHTLCPLLTLRPEGESGTLEGKHPLPVRCAGRTGILRHQEGADGPRRSGAGQPGSTDPEVVIGSVNVEVVERERRAQTP